MGGEKPHKGISSQSMIVPSTAPPHGMLLQLSPIVQISPVYLDFPMFTLINLLHRHPLNLAYALSPFLPIFSYLPRAPSSPSAIHIHSFAKPQLLLAVCTVIARVGACLKLCQA